jgi:phosphoribosylamine---glycine ligase
MCDSDRSYCATAAACRRSIVRYGTTSYLRSLEPPATHTATRRNSPMTAHRSPQRILIVGKDARTDAIAAACQDSRPSVELFALAEMRTPGLVAKCREVVTGSLTDRQLRAEVVRRTRPDLVIVGPEEPLADGFVDDVSAAGIPAFGPNKALAKIESSKCWARALLDRYDIPGNPDYQVINDESQLGQYLDDLGSFVIKPDGLTAGKGVRVFGEHLHSRNEAIAYASSLIRDDGRVLVEDRLDGEEFSLQTITDGQSVLHCPLVQDHKRAYEGDRGPNTGGMGSYSCADFSLPFLTETDLTAARTINERVIQALASESGSPYRGVLYGGFMATESGVQLIEYNARFGDPEAMNVLPLLRSDFVELADAVAHGRLDAVSPEFAHRATVCKYVVPSDYPDAVGRRGEISVPDECLGRSDTRWYWAAVEQEGEVARMTSSRSGAAVGIADSLVEAERLAERLATSVSGSVRHRADIGRQEAIQARTRHMEALRTVGAHSR